MFSICGIVNIDKQPVDLALLKDMADDVHQRDPDDRDVYCCKNVGLGIRRLSQMDLTKVRQPISNEDESIWVVQSGQIHNYRELRSETDSKGHVYRTKTDAEVIVHLYEEYGEDFADKLDGIFTIALWDKKQEKLILVRDRIGIKPLFYFLDKHKLIFSSEIETILKDPDVDRKINMLALNQYLTYRFVSAPLSMLNNIFKLLPAHMLIYKKGIINIKPYWDFRYGEIPGHSEDYYYNRLFEILKESLQRHIKNDIQPGIFLSGGIDSSILVGLMSKLTDKPIKTFSITFENEYCNESKYIRTVASRFETKHYELMVKPDAIQILPKLIQNMREPVGNSTALSLYHLLRFSREHVPVALAGDGGDELFVGYDRYRREKLVSLYSKIPKLLREKVIQPVSSLSYFQAKVKFLNTSTALSLEKRYKLWMEIMPEEIKHELIMNSNFDDADSADIIVNYFKRCAAPESLNKMLYVDLKTYLPDNLMLMASQVNTPHLLEIKAPFLDKKVVEFAATIPLNLKLRGFYNTKYLLRKYLKKYLPSTIYNRRKQGFNTPVNSWFRAELKDYAYQVLLDPTVNGSGIFNTKQLELLLDKHQKGESYGEAIWALVVFELWRRQHIDV